MNKSDNLKDVERKAYRSTFDDGLYEICYGLLALILGWIPVLESIGISRFYVYPLLVIPALIPVIGKRLITTPRLGVVEFGQKRKSRKRINLLLTAVVVILILPVTILMLVGGKSPGSAWLFLALAIAPITALVVYAMDYPRMFIYLAALLFAFAESEFLLPLIGSPLSSLLSFGLIGAGLLMFGVYLLVRFVRKYPKPSPEAQHVL